MLYEFTIILGLLVPKLLPVQASPPESRGIPASSRLGKGLLAKSRSLNEDNDENYGWLEDYSIQFDGCHTIPQFGGGEDNKDNEGNSAIYYQKLARFHLCPSGSCGNDCVGEYLVDLATFVDSYTESKMDAEEFACENTRENCVCGDDVDDEICETLCYADAGLDYCIESDDDEEEEEFEVQEYLECREMEIQNDDNNNNNNNNNNGEEIRYYVGPSCSSDGKSINLAVFTDETCNYQAPQGTYGTYNYGYSLPYESESLVAYDCVQCNKNFDNNNNNNDNNDVELSRMCEETFEQAAKCEDNLPSFQYYYYTPKVTDCTYVQESSKMYDVHQQAQGKSSNVAKAFAWTFFLSTLGLAGIVYTMFRKLERTDMSLASSVFL